MCWPLLVIGVLALASSGSEKRQERDPCVRHVPRPLPPPSRFRRTNSERRISEEETEEEDEGLVRKATLYLPCDWTPRPWALRVWTDGFEGAEVFALSADADARDAGLQMAVYWSESLKAGDRCFRGNSRLVDRDERFTNRLIHRYDGRASGTFLIEVSLQGEKVQFFHLPIGARGRGRVLSQPTRSPRPVLPQSPPPPPPPPPNPFEERLASFIRLQEQYEAAKTAALGRGLSENIARATLDELERVLQDEVTKLEEAAGGGSHRG